jgi:DNA/RNA endonuclease YhcR with UshA esterase domain
MNMRQGRMNVAQGMMSMPRYDVASETTITGTVEDVLQPQMGRMMGTHLMVKTDAGTIEVHVGPANFVNREGFTFAKGDEVQVLGSKVTIGGKEALIARDVTKDGKTLTLRDKTGRPLWARGRP